MHDSRIAKELDGIAAAIRAKQNWPVKLLDDERNLGEKWANEAGLVDRGVAPEQIEALIRDLKREAKRILSLDPVLGRHVDIPPDTADWSAIDAEVEQAKERIRQFKYAVREPALKEHVGVRVADGIVPRSLHSILEEELDRLGNVEVKDFHPGSDGKVQDLIHPSLYPYVQGLTRILDPNHPLNGFEKFTTETVYTVDEYSESTSKHESVYAWLPSVFDISDTGKVTIESPINALGPRSEHPALYKALERIFELALPQIEQSMFFEWKYEPFPSWRRWEERQTERHDGTVQVWRDKIEQQKKEKMLEEGERKKREAEVKEEIEQERQGVALGGLQGRSRLAGQKLKVIVKAANYVLTPGQEYEGSWHVEGAPHEHIRASLIYYYKCDPAISDAGLSFRRLRAEEDQPNAGRGHSDDFWVNNLEEHDPGDGIIDYPSDVEEGTGFPFELPRNIELGTVPSFGGKLPDGNIICRMLSFPNWLQHRVAGLKNTKTEGSEPALRKILCFFVVNEAYPEVDKFGHLKFPGFEYFGPHVGPNAPPVVTTADILPQERFRLFPYVYNALDMACKRASGGKGLPVELALDICEKAGVGMTRADAERHRRLLMDDRRAATQDVNSEWEASYGLCEH